MRVLYFTPISVELLILLPRLKVSGLSCFFKPHITALWLVLYNLYSCYPYLVRNLKSTEYFCYFCSKRLCIEFHSTPLHILRVVCAEVAAVLLYNWNLRCLGVLVLYCWKVLFSVPLVCADRCEFCWASVLFFYIHFSQPKF